MEKEYKVVYSVLEYIIKNKVEYINVFELYDIIGSKMYSEYKEFYQDLNYSFNKFELRLNSNIIYIFEQIPLYLAHFMFFDSLSREDQEKELNNFILEYDNSIISYKEKIRLLALIVAINKNNIGSNIYDFVCYFVWIFINYDENVKLIESKFELVRENFTKISLDYFCNNQVVLNILNDKNIYCIQDLYKSSIIIKYITCFCNLIKYRNLIEVISEKGKDNYQKIIDEFITTIPVGKYDVIKKRYGIETGDVITLEEVGNMYGLTRERVRQLIEEVNKRIIIKNKTYSSSIKNLFDFLFDEKYVFFEKIEEYFDNLEYARLFIIILSFCSYCQVNFKVNVLYNDFENIDSLINYIVDQHDFKIKEEEYRSYNKNIIKILDNHYVLQNGYFIKKGYTLNKITEYILDNYFNCYFKNNLEFLEKFNNIFINEFGYSEPISERNFKSILERTNYILVDKATYRKMNDEDNLSREIIDDIIGYLYELNSPILYSKLFKKFLLRLRNQGVENVYYFKVLIDLYLPNEFTKNKDYIQPIDFEVSPLEDLTKKIRLEQGYFTIDDIVLKYPNYSKNTIVFCIEREKSVDLVNLYNKQYIYREYLQINPLYIEVLKDVINLLLSSNNILDEKTLYNYVKHNYKNILEEYKEFNCKFNLYSLVKGLFYKDYYFKRPFIYYTAPELTLTELVNDFCSNKEIIDVETITKFLIDNHIDEHYDNVTIFDMISENFVMLSDTSFLNKAKVQLTEYEIDCIKLIITLIISKEHTIYSNNFEHYNLLPRLKYQWSKHLLLYILNSYLNRSFNIELIGDDDYMISLNKN